MLRCEQLHSSAAGVHYTTGCHTLGPTPRSTCVNPWSLSHRRTGCKEQNGYRIHKTGTPAVPIGVLYQCVNPHSQMWGHRLVHMHLEFPGITGGMLELCRCEFTFNRYPVICFIRYTADIDPECIVLQLSHE